LLIPREIPLDFSNVRLNSENGGIRGGSYLVSNNSRSGLVTLITFWRFQGDGPGPQEVTVTDVTDSWATDTAFLASGGEQQGDLNFHVFSPSDQKVRRVVGTVVYAEFEDGTRLGPGVGTFAPRLRSGREKTLSAYKQLLEKIQSGTRSEELERYMQSTPGLNWMKFVRAEAGWDGVVAEIIKPRRLTP
jgi:hypothetical protein